MLKPKHCKLTRTGALAGILGQSTVFAHGGIDAESGFMAVAVHNWLHTACSVPLVLLGAAVAISAVLVIAGPGRRATRKGQR
jgi:hypothetical protein